MMMKLIHKTLYYYLAICFPFLLISGFLSYYLIRSEVRDGTKDSLKKEKARAEQLVRELPSPQVIYLSADSLSVIVPYVTDLKAHRFTDTLIYDKKEKEFVNYLLLKSNYQDRGTTYRIHIVKPTLEEEELVEGLLSAFAIIAGFLVIAFFLVNLFLSRTLWRPFNKTLAALNNYSVSKHAALELDNTNITEFHTLNRTITGMTEKIHRDYIRQKEFTENASHEMQTPLAIIRISLENMLQSTNIREEELQQLQSIDKAVNKLSSLNKALVLLTKIENNQFYETEDVSLNQLATHLLEEYSILYASKEITWSVQSSSEVTLHINPVLAELLIGNLVKNAFRHNITGGVIMVVLAQDSFSIYNSGGPLQIDPKTMFLRFKKNDASAESLGLGLAIVKSIVTLYDYLISHSYTFQMHCFQLTFNKTKSKD